jgi:Phasin protein
MTQSMPRDTNGTSQAAGLDQWATAGLGLWAPFLANLQALNGSYGATFAAMTAEWNGFIAHRLKEDFELPQRLAKCSKPETALETCVGFCQQAMTDYQKEFAELTKIGSGFADASVKTLQQTLKDADKPRPTAH